MFLRADIATHNPRNNSDITIIFPTQLILILLWVMGQYYLSRVGGGRRIWQDPKMTCVSWVMGGKCRHVETYQRSTAILRWPYFTLNCLLLALIFPFYTKRSNWCSIRSTVCRLCQISSLFLLVAPSASPYTVRRLSAVQTVSKIGTSTGFLLVVPLCSKEVFPFSLTPF